MTPEKKILTCIALFRTVAAALTDSIIILRIWPYLCFFFIDLQLNHDVLDEQGPARWTNRAGSTVLT
jgi:hypothetical protein